MANNKMLIDATHPEETRVVVLRDGRVEEFDYESAARKPLRGNIYLAKVTRVEPSLQAAFVEYGGNRHGFLAFNEIHPDYYQIPFADRQALLDEEAAAEAEEEAEADARAERRARGGRRDRRPAHRGGARSDEAAGDFESTPDHAGEYDEDARGGEPAHDAPMPPFDEPHASPAASQAASDGLSDQQLVDEPAEAEPEQTEDGRVGETLNGDGEPADAPHAIGLVEDVGVHDVENGGGNGEAEVVEEVGASEDAMEEVPTRPRRRARSYKIQEVIKRRQVILVQVVKEERGNKGAALTTYLSLAGRYTVLMPNTGRGGGISRKITQPQDRKRLKAIAAELDVPDGMGLIIRTAGAARTKQEIKRDFEYLLRLWENVREMTLQSVAPNLVYEEGDLIKRSIRDHYTKDVDEILVAGEAAFHEARDFMGMLMPSHAKNVVDYREPEPLFTRFQIERQLNAMFSPFVTLRSGGYLVINQTEALVAVDVNSGKSTREFSIEETALNTNLEAADEIARQLKLRDLAGLIVVDFIDMEEKRNNRAVERRMKDALRFDRARIQVGRISHFGLLEMSRQRLRTGVLEGSTSQCPHCQGTGMIRSVESVALAVLRGLEDALMSAPRTSLVALTTAQVALYILNNKRAFIIDMERRSGVPISVQASDKMQGASFAIERGAQPVQPQRRPERAAVSMDWGFDASDNEPPEEAPEADFQAVDEIEEASEGRGERDELEDREGRDGDRRGRGRRRRRRGRRGEGEMRPVRALAGDQEQPDTSRAEARHELPLDDAGAAIDDLEDGGDAGPAEAAGATSEAGERSEDERRGRRRRRGRRGGRRGGRESTPGAAESSSPVGDGLPEAVGGDEPVSIPEGVAGHGVQPDVEFYAVLPEELPVPKREPRGRANWRERRPRPAAREDSPDPTTAEHGSEAQSPAEAVKAAATRAAELATAATEPVLVTGSAAQQPEQTSEAQQATEAPRQELPVQSAPVPPAAAETTAGAGQQKPRRVNGDPTAVTPRVERIVVKPDESMPVVVPPQSSGEPATSPARKGWWQRKFGGS